MVGDRYGRRHPDLETSLIDAEQRHRAHPDSFQISSLEERRGLRPLDVVKLGFEQSGMVERMWVEVESPLDSQGFYDGRLVNVPAILADLILGSPVRFEPRHVMSIERKSD